MRTKIPEADRFWSKVDRNGPLHPALNSRCWLWTAYKRPNGYGYLWFFRDGKWRREFAHRVVWDIAGSPLVGNEFSLHRCDNPPCVNYVDHLYKGSQADNLAEAGAKGRMTRDVNGSRNPRAILSADDVVTIRASRPPRFSKNRSLVESLAIQYGVSVWLIRAIWYNSKLWLAGDEVQP